MMENDKVGGYISQIEFNNGEKIGIAENDIVIFVGPNNAGKSQSLKDIHMLSERKVPTVVISDVLIKKANKPISTILSEISAGSNHGDYISYNVLGHDMNIWDYTDRDFLSEKYFGSFRDLFVANLDTSARLTICKPPQNIRRNGNKSHPIHYAAFDSRYRLCIKKSIMITQTKKEKELKMNKKTELSSCDDL